MKEVIKTSLSLFVKLIVVNFMCLMVVLSINVLVSGFFSEDIGYIATGVKEGEEKAETLYTYYYADGEDTKLAKFEAEGYKITKTSVKELSDSYNTAGIWFSQFLCFMLMASFVYPVLWKIGTKDSNLVKFKHQKQDSLKGLKIGLLAILPSVLLLVVLLVLKNGVLSDLPVAIYKLINSSLYGFIDLADGNATKFGQLSVLNFVFLALIQLIVPLVAYVSYSLGLKNISISEKIIYKKNKK